MIVRSIMNQGMGGRPSNVALRVHWLVVRQFSVEKNWIARVTTSSFERLVCLVRTESAIVLLICKCVANGPACLTARYLTIAKYLSSGKYCNASFMSSIRHYETLRTEIIRLLREARERQKLSKYEVAKRSGVSQSMLSLVERGLRNPTLELMLRFADGVGVDLADIIKKAQKSKGLAKKLE